MAIPVMGRPRASKSSKTIRVDSISKLPRNLEKSIPELAKISSGNCASLVFPVRGEFHQQQPEGYLVNIP